MQNIKKSYSKNKQIIRRSLYELVGNPKYSKPSLNDLDNKLAAYLDFKKGFFIEAGANDGFLQSNTYYLERIMGWSGVLVEGIPELYQKCKRLRRRSKVYHAALVANDYPDTHVTMHYANLMSVVDGSLKTGEAQVEQLSVGLKEQNIKSSYAVQVPARTLESILDELPQPLHIDFFSLDVEGYEMNVLKGLNIKKYSPTYILVEARFFDEVNAFLEPDYDLLEQLSYHDYLYKLR